MTRRLVVLLVGLLIVSSLAPAFAAGPAKEGTWKGEVLDLACYLSHGKKGASHAACAKACVRGGQPMGLLLEDGKVALLAADHADGAAYEKAKDFAGGRVEIRGTVAESSGITMITVLSVAAAK